MKGPIHLKRMRVIFVEDYSPRARAGTIATADAWRMDSQIPGGVQYRVVKLWKKPQWFNAQWFKNHV